MIPISERNELHLLAQRGTAARWAWTLTIHCSDGGYVTQLARGVEPTLTAPKRAAEA